MPKGYIDLSDRKKTDEEKADERWKCYQQLRENFPETFGSVDLSNLDLDNYFQGVDGDNQNSHNGREVKIMDFLKSKNAIIAIAVAVIAVLAIAITVTINMKSDDEIARQQLEVQKQQLDVELQRMQEDKARQKVSDEFLNFTVGEAASEPDYTFAEPTMPETSTPNEQPN